MGVWVHCKSEPGLWTVGFYDPAGAFVSESDWDTKEDAADRVHYLNGGVNTVPLLQEIGRLRSQLNGIVSREI